MVPLFEAFITSAFHSFLTIMSQKKCLNNGQKCRWLYTCCSPSLSTTTCTCSFTGTYCSTWSLQPLKVLEGFYFHPFFTFSSTLVEMHTRSFFQNQKF